MLDFDFRPEETTISKEKKGDKRLHLSSVLILLLLILTSGFAYLYLQKTRQLNELESKYAELQSTVQKTSGNTLKSSSFNPKNLHFEGAVKGKKGRAYIFEDADGRGYVLTDNIVIANWRVKVKGDSLLFESLETGENFVVQIGG